MSTAKRKKLQAFTTCLFALSISVLPVFGEEQLKDVTPVLHLLLNRATAAQSVISSGAITQFSSIYVNGVRYSTTAARVTLNDGAEVEVNPSDDRLKQIIGKGNIVKVRGTLNDDNTTGNASTIIVDDELVGAVKAGSITDATFVVLGQTISMSPATFIDDSLHKDGSGLDKRFGDLGVPLASLVSDGLVVEVSGYVTANGLEASRIEDFNSSDTAGTDYDGTDEVKGFVEDLDTPTPGQFRINDLIVDYSSINPAPTLANGDLVEVHGAVSSNTLVATTIKFEDNLVDDDFSEGEVEVEGIIMSITSTAGTAGVIRVKGLDFSVADISNYHLGMKVEIKARLQNGSLQVIRIENNTEDNIRIEDQVTGVAGDSISTRLGLQVTPSDRSSLELNDADNLDIAAFLSGIEAGDYVEARGFKLNNSIVWSRIEAESDNKDECRLRGPVAAAPSNPTFSIEGVTVTTNGSTQFRDASGLPIVDAATFFGMLSEGDVVQAKSASDGAACLSNNLNPAKEVSFEPDDDVLEGNGDDDDNGVERELKGPVSNITGATFDIAGETIAYDGTTLIDDSIIEDVDGGEVANDQALGATSLSHYISEDGTPYVVTVDRSGSSPFATLIEDF